MIFQDDNPSIAADKFKDHYEPFFDLTTLQNATEKFHYAELVEEPMKLELNFSFPLEHVIELILLGERTSLVSVDTFGVPWKNI